MRNKRGGKKKVADVRLKNICKVYDSRDKGHGGVLAVKNFSMDIKDGEFIVFVGPSGCGKQCGIREEGRKKWQT